MRQLLQRPGRTGAYLDLLTISAIRRVQLCQRTVKITVFAVDQHPVTARRLREHARDVGAGHHLPISEARPCAFVKRCLEVIA